MNKDIFEEVINKYMGYKAIDKVTGFRGIVASVSFDLYGCLQLLLTPANTEGKSVYEASYWFDLNRIRKTGSTRILPVPLWDKHYEIGISKGPANKPPLM